METNDSEYIKRNVGVKLLVLRDRILEGAPEYEIATELMEAMVAVSALVPRYSRFIYERAEVIREDIEAAREWED